MKIPKSNLSKLEFFLPYNNSFIENYYQKLIIDF